MTKDDIKALKDLFEGSFDKATAMLMLGLEGVDEASRTWDRWQAEIDEFGCYVEADPGSPQGLLAAVFTGIGDMIWDDDAWRELNEIVDAASPFREIWG